ncbi:zinc finger, CCHC-type containing protein [Tanacetum coccineum]|uniref:Zinc finger, CCHC-type containing protein n=1 Tax=Tanacetum coccineum TaxID=301880 RepID=A0ABQ5CWP9_9ASTR
MLTECGDDAASIKQRHHDLRSDGVNISMTLSEHGRPKETLEDLVKDTIDSIDLNGATRNTTRLHLFCFSLCEKAIKWLDRLLAGSISTWDDLTTRFLAQFIPPGRTAKL